MKKYRPNAPSNQQEFLQRSSLYKEFLEEREEILKHKWIESEKVGYDIGFERALLDWIRNHRDEWRAKRRQSLAESRSAKASVDSAGNPGSLDSDAASGKCVSQGLVESDVR